MFGFLLLAVIAVFVSIVAIRTISFKPKVQPPVSGEEFGFDKEAAVDALAQLVRCKTVSYNDHTLEDDAEFDKLISLLPTLYPRVFDVCSVRQLPDRALLLRWPGKDHGDPAVLMAHYDVVPVNEENWDKPPFAGILENGVLWGRGTLDTKVTFNGIFSAANYLIGKGFQPENDIYFAFSGGEEVNGKGAPNIVQYFLDHHIQPAIVVDEGGAVVENVFPGVSTPCGLIGIAEKGMMNVTLSIRSNGGHASAPKPHTPVGELSAACCAMENKPFPFHLTPPVAALFDTLGRHSTFVYRLIFSNLWLFRGVLDFICKKSGGELNALCRTTVAFTQASGSNAPNVIPPSASMTANLRLNPKDTVESATERIRKTIDNDRIEISVRGGVNPSPISRIDCDGWNKVASSVAATWPGCIVSPYLMVQCSDSRHYGKISDRVYRFSAMDLTAEERRTIHGHDERIRLECVKRAAEFYIRLLRQC